ncbi:MAG: co-chaperone GroES [Planctomycetota bacterium]|jgi:co-chaperonin GroES (HSP10)
MTPESIQPVREIVFIKRQEEDDKFANSPIVRPDSFRAEMCVAEVLGVGDEIEDKFAVGDKVYLGKLAGLKVVELNGPYFLVHYSEIMAKVS